MGSTMLLMALWHDYCFVTNYLYNCRISVNALVEIWDLLINCKQHAVATEPRKINVKRD